MGQIQVARLHEPRQFRETQEVLERDNPAFRLSLVTVDGAGELRAESGGMRVFWVYQGQGEIFLPSGYRTQEGDGQPLPETYRPDRLDPEFAETLRVLRSGLASLAPTARVPVQAIVSRWRRDAFVGDIAGELWKIEQVPVPWSTDERVAAALRSLFGVYRQHGYSTKQADSFELLMAGDQVIACGDEAIRVRGQFACLAVENVERKTSHVSAARRLRFLLDTSGGCNPDFDPFRRLPLTWYANYPGESGDGLNFVNSHVVNIPKETSPSHFHPRKSATGGLPQTEMYLVLDPRTYQLNTFGRPASLIAFPDLRDLTRYEQHRLDPGTFVYIPPETGHRGLDVFVNVLTIPGFKPHNEYYIDRDICEANRGQAPFNETMLESKNYARLEELL